MSATITNIGSYTVFAPKFANKPLLMRAVLGGWNFSGRYGVRSGLPVNIILNTDYALTNSPNQRPNLLHSWIYPGTRSRINQLALSGNTYFDPTAFSTSVPSGTFGNVSRNLVRGPANITNNMSLARRFPLPREGRSFEFRADAFGVFNTPNLGTPSNKIGTSLRQITSTSGQRFLQLSGHLRF